MADKQPPAPAPHPWPQTKLKRRSKGIDPGAVGPSSNAPTRGKQGHVNGEAKRPGSPAGAPSTGTTTTPLAGPGATTAPPAGAPLPPLAAPAADLAAIYYLMTSPSPWMNPLLNLAVRATLRAALLSRNAIPGSGQPSYAKPRSHPLDVMTYADSADAAMDAVQRLDL